VEVLTLDRAAASPDHAEELQALSTSEIDGLARPSIIVKLGADSRLCEKRVVDLVARMNRGWRVGQVTATRRVEPAPAGTEGRGLDGLRGFGAHPVSHRVSAGPAAALGPAPIYTGPQSAR
jgi:hypothetical protein